jgi:lysophospholipase L1-like esterase
LSTSLFESPKTPEQYKKAYDEALSIIRKYHPKTKIFCITIHTMPEGKKGRFAPMAAYRKPVEEIVAARRAAGDKNLFLVKGTELVGLDGAATPGNVHLSIDGADTWAKNLARIIRKVERKGFRSP